MEEKSACLSLKVLATKIGVCWFVFGLACTDAISPQYVLHTRSNRHDPEDITNSILPVFLRNRTETKLLVHGFSDSGDTAWIIAVKDAYLDNYDRNVIIVNWSEDAKGPIYTVAANNAKAIGQYTSRLIRRIGIDPLNEVHCVGHSLGSHVCGFCGKENRLSRITALDPAGPCFYYIPLPVICDNNDQKDVGCDNRLCKTDASYVDVIHTSSMFGIFEPIGHADYYPNGGKLQRAKWFSCSHQRAHTLFLESITNKDAFTQLTYQCTSFDDYKKALRSKTVYPCLSKDGHMGEFSRDSNSSGTYYLLTDIEFL